MREFSPQISPHTPARRSPRSIRSGACLALLCLSHFALAAPQIPAQNPPANNTPQSAPQTTSSIAFTRLPPAAVRAQLQDWLKQNSTPPDRIEQILQSWPDNAQLNQLPAEDTLDRLIDSFALADEPTQQLVNSCRTGKAPLTPDFTGPRNAPFFRSHLQLWLARWLVQHRFHDEALPLLEALSPEQLADPASLFFYRAASRLQLLQPGPAGDDLTLLLNNTPDVPPRFRAVAQMMQAEVRTALGNRDGLPQVARLMTDVQRRLDLGKADQPVQKRENEVIDALDKLLKQLEEQQQQQQQQQQQDGQGGGNQNMQNAQPRQQPGTQGIRGDGRADSKELTENGAWGMLDKQQEVQARELIRQQFPPNFLDAISRYTQKLAEQKK